jgi:hypothetical protein
MAIVVDGRLLFLLLLEGLTIVHAFFFSNFFEISTMFSLCRGDDLTGKDGQLWV